MANIAVLEKGWIGSGNIGRNTTIIRSNYLLDGNETFYEQSLKLWEGLEQELNYNTMMSQRGIINLYHSDPQRDAFIRRGNAMRLHGADAKLLTQDQLHKICPFLDFENARFPIMGGLMQPRVGTARHDAVPGATRGLQISAVSISFKIARSPTLLSENGICTGVQTGRGRINAGKLALRLPDQQACYGKSRITPSH